MTEPAWLDAISDPDLAPREGWAWLGGAWRCRCGDRVSKAVHHKADEVSLYVYSRASDVGAEAGFVPMDQARDALRSLHRAWELLEVERDTWGQA